MTPMKLLKALVEDALEKSPLLVKTVTAIDNLATEVHNLGMATMALAHTVQAHHAALQELYARQGLVMKAIKSNSLDMNMPTSKSKEPAKPN